MHIALPTTDKRPQIHHISAGVANNNSSSQKQEPLEARIKAANAQLAKLGIRDKKNSKLLEDIREGYQLPKDIKVHLHKEKNENGQVKFDLETNQPLKIAEFCLGHDVTTLHKPLEKKTSICTGTQCEPAAEKPKGFFQRLFSTVV